MRRYAVAIVSVVCVCANAEEKAVKEANPKPNLTAENIADKTGILQSPGLAVDNAKKVLGSGPEISLENMPKRISDPTQMTGSFSQALSRIRGKSGAAAAGVTAAPRIPAIELAAKVYLQKSKAVLLKFGGKSHLVKEGGKVSFLDRDELYEIQVDRIEREAVLVTVLPLGQQLRLE